MAPMISTLSTMEMPCVNRTKEMFLPHGAVHAVKAQPPAQTPPSLARDVDGDKLQHIGGDHPIDDAGYPRIAPIIKIHRMISVLLSMSLNHGSTKILNEAKMSIKKVLTMAKKITTAIRRTISPLRAMASGEKA